MHYVIYTNPAEVNLPLFLMTTLFRCSPNFIRLHLQSPKISLSSCRVRKLSNKISNPPAKADPGPEYSGYYAGSAEEQFGSNAFWAFRNLGRILAWVGYGTVVGGIATLTAYEGAHLWIEQRMRFDQDEDAKAWGWEPELWSGGDNGGTSASLGLYGRHVVRAAWFALHYHSPFAGFAVHLKDRDEYSLVDSDVQTARVYLESVLAGRKNEDGTLRLDRVTLELLEQYASVSERIGTRAALIKAGESYSLIYHTRKGDPVVQARYATKLGNISERAGDGKSALAWWKQSLDLLGQAEGDFQEEKTIEAVSQDTHASEKSNLPDSPGINEVTQRRKETKVSTFGTSTSAWSVKPQKHSRPDSSEAFPSSSSLSVPAEDGVKIPDLPPRSPLGQRVLITVLLALSAHYSRQGRLSEAKSIQGKAMSLIDLMKGRSVPSGKVQTWAEKLHHLFLLHRLSLLHIHHGEINFALSGSSSTTTAAAMTDILTELHKAASLSEKVANALTEGVVGGKEVILEKSKWMARDARTLLRDARLTATEAWDLSGVMYRRMGSDPEKATECFERALRWAAEPESGASLLSVQAWESLLERLKESKERHKP